MCPCACVSVCVRCVCVCVCVCKSQGRDFLIVCVCVVCMVCVWCVCVCVCVVCMSLYQQMIEYVDVYERERERESFIKSDVCMCAQRRHIRCGRRPSSLGKRLLTCQLTAKPIYRTSPPTTPSKQTPFSVRISSSHTHTHSLTHSLLPFPNSSKTHSTPFHPQGGRHYTSG